MLGTTKKRNMSSDVDNDYELEGQSPTKKMANAGPSNNLQDWVELWEESPIPYYHFVNKIFLDLSCYGCRCAIKLLLLWLSHSRLHSATTILVCSAKDLIWSITTLIPYYVIEQDPSPRSCARATLV